MTMTIKDPVTCSGGFFGGRVVEGEGWAVGEERTMPGDDGWVYTYRRITFDDDTNTEDQAIMVKTEKE